MEEALRASERKYRQLVEHAVDGIILGDASGHLIDVNPKACEMTGYALKDLLGRHISELYSKSVLQQSPLRFDLLQEGRSVITERDLLRADGTLLAVEMNSRRMPDGTYQAFLRDITERRRVDAELARERATLDHIIDLNPYAIQIADTSGRIVRNNQAVASIFGSMPPADYCILKDPVLEQNGVLTFIRRALEGHAAMVPPFWYNAHEATQCRVSKRLCLRSFVFSLLGPDGQVEHIVLMHEDITETARAEEALRASQARNAAMLAAMPDFLFINDREGRFLDCHSNQPDQLLLPPDQFLGKNVRDLLPEALADQFVESFGKVLDSSQIQELDYQLSMGDGQKHFEARIVPCTADSVLTIIRDTTESRRAKEALRRSEEQLRTLINAMPDIVCFKDGLGRWIEANEFALKLFYLKGLPYSGKTEAELAELQPFLREAFRECGNSDEDAWREGKPVRCEEVIPRLDGPARVFDTIKVPLFHSNGSRRGIVALGRDVTEGKQAERALRESEDRFRALCDNAIDSLFWIRVEEGGTFRVEGINPAQEKVLGLKNEDVQGRRLRDFLPPHHSEPILDHYRRCLEVGQPLHYEESAEFYGELKTFETLLVPIRDAQGRIYRIVGNSRDVSQARRAEEALRQAQKLESLGILAGGIAHDFNNLLTAMLGNLNLAQLKSSPESPALPYLENVEKIVLRASDLTKQMLAYSGKGRFVVMPHDLNKVVREMTHLLNVSISKKVSLQYELAPSLPTFEADAAQIQQVVLNLVTNASEAIGEGEGAIRIVTKEEHLDAGKLAPLMPGQSLEAGSYVVLEVSDTGCGMDQEVLARIFDPFFTTKRSGRGLGLSAMLGILRGHHAGIHIASAPGEGSTFTLYFPAKSGCVPLETSSPQVARPGGCKGRVLLVDDEEIVRESTAAMLECLGLEVLQALDGQDAVTRFQGLKGTIDLVLMDLTMPHMDGREAFAQLRLLQADLPVILFSGFSEGDSLRDSLGDGLAGFLQKPFDLADLKRAVRSVLPSVPK